MAEEMSARPGGQELLDAGEDKVTELIAGGHSSMVELLNVMSNAQPGTVDPQDIQRLQGIIQEYRSFVTENLGGGGEQQAPQQAPEAGGNVPLEAGAANVQPAL